MSVRELNESEPFDDMSKRHLVVKSIDFQQLIRKTVADSCLPATEQPALRRQESYIGFYMEREKLSLRCAKSLPTSVGIQGVPKEAEA